MSKYDKFWNASASAGNLVEEVNKVFGKYGAFTIESAEFSLMMQRFEGIKPELFAFTWMNESTFKLYSEPNRNEKRNPEDSFDKYDVGPLQMNVGQLKANIDNKFISIKGLELAKIIGTKGPLFNGDPVQNSQCASRFLLRIGRGEIVANRQGKSVVLFPKATTNWNDLSVDEQDARRAVAYTGPDARPFRLDSWMKFGPMYKKFFEEFVRV